MSRERYDRTREQLDGVVNEIFQLPDGHETKQLQLLSLILELLIDIRESLYRGERDRSSKWGSKL